MNGSLFASQLAAIRSYAPLQTIWGLARRELLYLSWALMEIGLITPISLALMRWARYWPPGQVMLWLLLMMLIPFNLLRLLAALHVSWSRQQLIIAIGLLLLLLFSSSALLYHSFFLLDWRWLPAFFRNISEKGNQLWLRDVLLFLFVVLAWSRGAALPNREYTINGAGLFLRLGGLIAAPLIIWLGSARLQSAVIPFLLLFFAAGLTAIALIRAEEIERQESGYAASFSPRWLSGILTTSFLIVLTAAILAGLISGETIYAVVGWLSPLWSGLALAGAVIIATLTYLFLPLFQLLEKTLALLISLAKGRLPASTGEPYSTERILTPDDLLTIARGMNLWAKVVVFLLIFLLVLLIVLALERARRRRQIVPPSAPLATHPWPLSPEDEGLGRRFLRRLGLWRNWRTAVSIRHIYRQMSRAAAASGYPRSESETPYEYLVPLSKVWPANQEDAALITAAYVKVRYGELPESQEEFEQILRAWQQLEQAKLP